MEVQPLNIIAAALLTKVLVIFTLFLGAGILGDTGYGLSMWIKKKNDPLKLQIIAFPRMIIFTTVLTLGALVVSDEFVTAWRPLIGSTTFSVGLKTPTAISFMFFADIVLVAYLVWRSQGSRRSPFSPVFFILPAIAVFLREPLNHLILYFGLVILFFSLLMICEELPDSSELDGPIAWSYWAVSFLSFVVTAALAILTHGAV